MPKLASKKKFANKMRSIVSAVKVAQRLEVRDTILENLALSRFLKKEKIIQRTIIKFPNFS